MNVKSILATATLLAAISSIAAGAHADTLVVEHAHARHHHAAHYAETGNTPSRGMSMAQVERRYGVPLSKLNPAGGDTRRHPTINRWRYNGFTVYFERNRVIHSVLDNVAYAPQS